MTVTQPETVTQEQTTTVQGTGQKLGTLDILGSILDETARKQYEMVLADKFAASTYAEGAGVKIDEAATLIALGRDYGWGPAHSLQRLYMRDKKPHLYAEARANMLAKAGYSWMVVNHTDKECRYQFQYKGKWIEDVHGKPLQVAVTMEDATKAGWVQNSRGDRKEGNYDKVPKNMLFARMITNFHRWHAAGVDGANMSDDTDLIGKVVNETERLISEKTDAKIEQLREQLTAVKGDVE